MPMIQLYIVEHTVVHFLAHMLAGRPQLSPILPPSRYPFFWYFLFEILFICPILAEEGMPTLQTILRGNYEVGIPQFTAGSEYNF